jgi:hypothetical protein
MSQDKRERVFDVKLESVMGRQVNGRQETGDQQRDDAEGDKGARA